MRVNCSWFGSQEEKCNLAESFVTSRLELAGFWGSSTQVPLLMRLRMQTLHLWNSPSRSCLPPRSQRPHRMKRANHQRHAPLKIEGAHLRLYLGATNPFSKISPSLGRAWNKTRQNCLETCAKTWFNQKSGIKSVNGQVSYGALAQLERGTTK